MEEIRKPYKDRLLNSFLDIFKKDIDEFPALFYVNIGLLYSYSKQYSAYLQLNNLTIRTSLLE